MPEGQNRPKAPLARGALVRECVRELGEDLNEEVLELTGGWAGPIMQISFWHEVYVTRAWEGVPCHLHISNRQISKESASTVSESA